MNVTEQRPIDGFQGYTITMDGTVRDVKGRIIRHYYRNGGVACVPIYEKTKWGRLYTVRVVARLVGAAFMPDFHRAKRPVYVDGNRGNPHANNLKWVSVAEVSIPPRGEARRTAKLTEADVMKIRKSSESGVELARKFGVTKSHIVNIMKRRSWRHLP